MPDSNFSPLRIVSMGGGNGLSALLRGLKRYAKIGTGAVEITAVVTVTDTPLPFRVSYASSGSLWPRASLQSGLQNKGTCYKRSFTAGAPRQAACAACATQNIC